MGILDTWGKSTGSTARTGDQFTDGRGKAILTEARLFKSKKTGEWMKKLAFFIKESHPVRAGVEPNAAGTFASLVINLDAKFQKDFSNAQLCAMFGLVQGDVDGFVQLVMRLFGVKDDEKYTPDGFVTPARGYEFNYSTRRKDNAPDGYLSVDFAPVMYPDQEAEDAAVAANLALISGAKAA